MHFYFRVLKTGSDSIVNHQDTQRTSASATVDGSNCLQCPAKGKKLVLFAVVCPNSWPNQFSTDIEIKRLQSELNLMQKMVVVNRKIKISLCLFDERIKNTDGIELKNNSLAYKGRINLNYNERICNSQFRINNFQPRMVR